MLLGCHCHFSANSRHFPDRKGGYCVEDHDDGDGYHKNNRCVEVIEHLHVKLLIKGRERV